MQQDVSSVLRPLGVVLVVAVLAGAMFFGISYLAEQDRLRKAAAAQLKAEIKHARKQIDEIIEHRKEEDFAEHKFGTDPWGTEYRVEIVESEEKVFKGCVVSSAGPDKVFHTTDDIVGKNDDLNWTKAGESLGVKTGRTARGFFKGLWNSGDGK